MAKGKKYDEGDRLWLAHMALYQRQLANKKKRIERVMVFEKKELALREQEIAIVEERIAEGQETIDSFRKGEE